MSTGTMNPGLSILMFFKTLGQRFNGKNTTVGGGVLGLVLAAIIGKVEEMSGCKFTVAFGNVDWVQLVGFVFMQLFGAVVTDADKIVATQPITPGNT